MLIKRREVVDVPVVVVGAELVESGVGVGKQMPDDQQQRAANRDDGPLLASAAAEASVAATASGAERGIRPSGHADRLSPSRFT